MKLPAHIKHFLHHQSGAILVEFVFVLPILLILIFGTIDYSRYILLQQKVIKTSYVIADAVAMSRGIEDDTTQDDVDSDGTYLVDALLPELMDTVPTLMSPFEQSGAQDLFQVVVSHVRFASAADPVITWQYDENSRSFDNGARISTIGVATGFNNSIPALLPPSLTNNFDAGANVISVETTATFQPITPVLTALGVPFLQETDLSYIAYIPGRYDNLQYIWQANCPPLNNEPGC